jgi:hypothetical protein
MSKRELVAQELGLAHDDAEDNLLRMAAQTALVEDWLSPEEDAAWADLQRVTLSSTSPSPIGARRSADGRWSSARDDVYSVQLGGFGFSAGSLNRSSRIHPNRPFYCRFGNRRLPRRPRVRSEAQRDKGTAEPDPERELNSRERILVRPDEDLSAPSGSQAQRTSAGGQTAGYYSHRGRESETHRRPGGA